MMLNREENVASTSACKESEAQEPEHRQDYVRIPSIARRGGLMAQ
ncbi:MAG: hypothetical protein ACRESS_02835 [Stenotrophobium sp.]